MRLHLHSLLIVVGLLAACGAPVGTVSVVDPVRPVPPQNEPTWFDGAEQVIGWPRSVQDATEVSFSTARSEIESAALPEGGHQPWLNDPALVAATDLKEATGEGGAWYTLKWAVYARGELFVLKRYIDFGGPLRTVRALIFRNLYGRCFTLKAWVTCQSSGIGEIVADLGHPNRRENNRLVAALHQEPRRSVRLLVEELHKVDPAWPLPMARHVAWCVRALESITGRQFTFAPTGTLSPELGLPSCETQVRVLTAWKAWVDEHGETFDPVKEPRVYNQ